MRYRIMTTKSGGGFSGQGLTMLSSNRVYRSKGCSRSRSRMACLRTMVWYTNDKASRVLASSQRCPPRCNMAHENVEGQELLIDVPPAAGASEAGSVIHAAIFHSAVLHAS